MTDREYDKATNEARRAHEVLLYLCECGPILKDGIDLDAIAAAMELAPNVAQVKRFSTLCSEEGRDWMVQELRDFQAEREADCGDFSVVVAGCSPREHGETMMQVMRQAGLNPFRLTIANIREQCLWVTPDRDQATAKALAIVRATVARAIELHPLDEQEIDCRTDALVVGAGVAGLTAAKLLADGGRKVVLIEREWALGGRVARLSDVYPRFECASCMLEPLIDEVLHHPAIEIFTACEPLELLGDKGDFTVRLRRAARHVDPEGCYGCGTCVEACPAELPNAVDYGFSMRKAIDTPYPGALPHAVHIETGHCLNSKGEACETCVGACPFGNIDLAAREEIVERQVGAVLLATGAEPRSVAERGASRRVLPAMAFERMLNASGPTGGQPVVDGNTPRSIALIHCVDDHGRAPSVSCSKVCCMAFTKYIHRIVELLPECDIVELLWERCAGGKGYRELCNSARVRSRKLQQVWLDPADRILSVAERDAGARIRFEDRGAETTLDVDLVVVAPPLGGARGIETLGAALRVELDAEGFLLEGHERLASFTTRRDGIFVAGCAQSPKDIQEAAAHGAAAAGAVFSALVPGQKLRLEPATAEVCADLCGGCRLCAAVCPYQAITYESMEGRGSWAHINECLCRGCGSCAAACPSGAIEARNFTNVQIEAEIASFTGDETP